MDFVKKMQILPEKTAIKKDNTVALSFNLSYNCPMKTIYIVFNNKEKIDVWSSMYDNLKAVFADYVSVKICFLDETNSSDLTDGDLFLVLYRDRVYPMKKYVSSLDKVIVMSRTVQRKYLDELYELPEGTELLVVNDSEESTIQTANNLYALGLNHLNLVPFLPNEPNPAYGRIRIAVTPDEEDMVPPHINRIINIQSRCIDTNTFITIINKLNLNNDQITRNLLKYTQTLASSGTDPARKYITDNLKEEMLKNAFEASGNAILLTDASRVPVYCNDKAAAFFNITVGSSQCLLDRFGRGYEDIFSSEDYQNRLIRIEGSNYIFTRSTIRIVDQVIGYSFYINTEKELKNMELDINKQLIKSGLVAKYHFKDIIGHSDAMEQCIARAKKVALTDFTVLISGESGTGKELMAQSIHNFSARKDRPFVAINCAALPESLLESELFGYEKGAFTGASAQGKLGLFEQANRGTVFLDEIGDMSLNLQARLLRVLQEKQLMRLGSDKVINIDVRIIAATNRDLPEAIRRHEFREDLYYRLCNIPINLPPLRERKEDIPAIFTSFLDDADDLMTNALFFQLKQYDWPGNIRELKNAADYFRTLGELPDTVQNAAPAGSNLKIENTATDAIMNVDYPEDSELNVLILTLIRTHSTASTGIGRTAILQLLRERNIRISDNKLRLRLHELEKQNLIYTTRGRTGFRLR